MTRPLSKKFCDKHQAATIIREVNQGGCIVRRGVCKQCEVEAQMNYRKLYFLKFINEPLRILVNARAEQERKNVIEIVEAALRSYVDKPMK